MSRQRIKKGKGLHVRNIHAEGYDFDALVRSSPELKQFVRLNPHGKSTIQFSDALAVKSLNRALLNHHYGIEKWDIPEGFLCPPVPGRVDYIHYVAELLGVSLDHPQAIKMLDIGTGANGIYALLACQLYGWNCTASDIDPVSLENVTRILRHNPILKKRIQLRLQKDTSYIFKGIIQAGESYDVSVCNPPFHASLEEARKENLKKNQNLRKSKVRKSESTQLNFGGQKAELWCPGGEIRFLKKMLKESKKFAHQCKWFTTLISKSENVAPSIKLLKKLAVAEVKELNMQQGNKLTRILAWRF